MLWERFVRACLGNWRWWVALVPTAIIGLIALILYVVRVLAMFVVSAIDNTHSFAGDFQRLVNKWTFKHRRK